MGLRGQVPDNEATYEDPVLGVNLHDSEEDLRAGETSLMKNLVYFGGTVSRTGSNAITASQVASSFGVKGGHKAYFNIPSQNKARLIAYDTNISTITDGGFETVIVTRLPTSTHILKHGVLLMRFILRTEPTPYSIMTAPLSDLSGVPTLEVPVTPGPQVVVGQTNIMFAPQPVGTQVSPIQPALVESGSTEPLPQRVVWGP